MADTIVAPSSDEAEQYPSPVRGKGGAIPTPARLTGDARALWDLAFEDALQVECQTAVDPRQCAIQVAWKAVKEKYGETSEDFVARDIDEPVIDPIAFQRRREFSRQKREGLADEGKALPWGGFPIENCGDVKNAVQAIGRAKDRSKTIAHITTRAKSLGCSHLLPKKWRGGNQGASEKSMAGEEDDAMSDEKLALAARGAGIDPIALQKRRAVRAKEAAEDQALLNAGYSDHPARRPDSISSVEWSRLPIEERTVGAVVWRRHCLRSYAEAVEDAVLGGWKAEKNPHRGSEWIFKSWVETPDGWQLVRGILVRLVDKSDWYMKEVSRGASLSLAIRVAPDEVRR